MESWALRAWSQQAGVGGGIGAFAGGFYDKDDDVYYTDFDNAYGGDRSGETIERNGLPGQREEATGKRDYDSAKERQKYKYRPSRFAVREPELVMSEF